MLAGRALHAIALSVPSEQLLKSLPHVYCRIWCAASLLWTGSSFCSDVQ